MYMRLCHNNEFSCEWYLLMWFSFFRIQEHLDWSLTQHDTLDFQSILIILRVFLVYQEYCELSNLIHCKNEVDV